MEKINNLVMMNITKLFQGVTANSGVDISIAEGEILGLLGENGAGKTTLMNILYGLYQPDSGAIRINGKNIRIKSPIDSRRQGIGMVHQHFMLIPNHSVAENIALGYDMAPQMFPQRKITDSHSRLCSKI
jgi:simple sugar transport system ATP-binding protein